MRLLGPAIVVGLLVADQISKWFMLEHVFRERLGLGDPMRLADWLQNAPERLPDISITVLPFFNLTMVWNFGISFGLMSGAGMALLILTIAITSFFTIWMFRSKDKVSNFISRLFQQTLLKRIFVAVAFDLILVILNL